MGVKIVAADIGKIGNIRFGDGVLGRDDRFADLQLFEMFPENMKRLFHLLRTVLINIGNSRDRGWRTLDGASLQVVFYPAHAAHLLTAARTTRAAVNQ